MRTIIRWTGEDPDRDGLRETPARVTRSFEEFFAGYGQDPIEILKKTFEEIEGYDEMIVLRGIRFESHCEHHMQKNASHAAGLHRASLGKLHDLDAALELMYYGWRGMPFLSTSRISLSFDRRLP